MYLSFGIHSLSRILEQVLHAPLNLPFLRKIQLQNVCTALLLCISVSTLCAQIPDVSEESQRQRDRNPDNETFEFFPGNWQSQTLSPAEDNPVPARYKPEHKSHTRIKKTEKRSITLNKISVENEPDLKVIQDSVVVLMDSLPQTETLSYSEMIPPNPTQEQLRIDSVFIPAETTFIIENHITDTVISEEPVQSETEDVEKVQIPVSDLQDSTVNADFQLQEQQKALLAQIKSLSVQGKIAPGKIDSNITNSGLSQEPWIPGTRFTRVKSLNPAEPSSQSAIHPLQDTIIQPDFLFRMEALRSSLFTPLTDYLYFVNDAITLDLPVTPEKIQIFNRAWTEWKLRELRDSALEIRKRIKWNDAGYYLQCGNIASMIYPDNQDAARLLTALIMQNSGLEVSPALQDGRVTLIVHTLQDMYELPKLYAGQHTHGGYYLWQPDAHGIHTGEILTPGLSKETKLRALDLLLLEYPALPSELIQKSILYKDPVSRVTDTFQIHLNLYYLNFLSLLPQVSPEVYFASPLSPSVRDSLLPVLRRKISEMRPYESLGWMLRFIQFAFPYQTDEQQFGKEKAMFPEEALFYPSTDCEDRSVLFASLVREVLGRPVIGLDFPGHMATAVMVPEKEARGARIRYAGRTFMACDPSYKRALPGALHPDFSHQHPVPVPAPLK